MNQAIFEPYTLGSTPLRNRIVMAPLTRSRATDNVPNDLMVQYYRQRAGAGLVITEGTSPSPNGVGYARMPGIYNAEQAAGWKKVTDAVHAEGGRIFVQLMHTGRVSHALNLPAGARVLAPSAVRADQQMYTDAEGMKDLPTPEAMTEADIAEAVQEHVKAAQLAIEAGFDGIELHGANGYLIEQFLNPTSNVRTDAYGDDITGRFRFLDEVVAATTAAIGADRVGLRLSPFGVNGGMALYEHDAMIADYTHIAEQLKGRLAYLHIVDHSAFGAPAVPAELKAAMKAAFAGSLILCGNFNAETAATALTEGRSDLIAMGRPWIANPDLMTRIERGAPLNDPDPNTFYTPGEQGYTDYPTLAATLA